MFLPEHFQESHHRSCFDTDACAQGAFQVYSYVLQFVYPNSFSYRGSYFEYRGEGTQILWICFAGGGLSGEGWLSDFN